MYFVLLLLLPALLVFGESHEQIQLTSLKDDCELDFSHTGFKFDLCPLFRGHAHLNGSATWRDRTPPTETTRELRWNFGGPLARKPDTGETDQCPEGTWICLTDTNRRLVDLGSSARITKLVPIAGELTASSKHGEHKGHGDEDEIPKSTRVDMVASVDDLWRLRDVLYLRLYGGYYNQLPQHAVIRFYCDVKAQEPTGPDYWGAWNNTHWINWRTRHACATSIDPHAPGAPHPEEHQHGGDDDEHGERPPTDTFVPDARTRTIWTRASWLGAAALLVAVLVLAQTGRLPALTKRAYPALRALGARHPLRAFYSRFTLGLGERALVRWARRRAGYADVDARDETLFDVELDGDGEEGAWVSAEQGEARRPEQTPLSPNRVNTFGVKTYGTR